MPSPSRRGRSCCSPHRPMFSTASRRRATASRRLARVRPRPSGETCSSFNCFYQTRHSTLTLCRPNTGPPRKPRPSHRLPCCICHRHLPLLPLPLPLPPHLWRPCPISAPMDGRLAQPWERATAAWVGKMRMATTTASLHWWRPTSRTRCCRATRRLRRPRGEWKGGVM